MKAQVRKTLEFVVARAKERSTWQGIVGLLTAFGVTLAPAQTAAVITIGAGAASIVHMLFPQDGYGGEQDGDDSPGGA